MLSVVCMLRQVQDAVGIPELIGYVPDSQHSLHPSHMAITNTGGCHIIGTLGNVPFAQGHCTVAGSALAYQSMGLRFDPSH